MALSCLAQAQAQAQALKADAVLTEQAAPALSTKSREQSTKSISVNSTKKDDLSRAMDYVQQNAKLLGERVAASSHASASLGSSASKISDLAKAIRYTQQNAKLENVTVTQQPHPRQHTQVFTANIVDAKWQAMTNAFACSLTHSIPSFGKAVFMRKAGEDDIFYMELQDSIIFPVGNASIDTLPALWRNEEVPENIGQVIAAPGNRPIQLKANEMLRLVKPLTHGTKVMFTSAAIENSKNIVAGPVGVLRVVLQPRNFLPAYTHYQQCIHALIPYTFAQVSRLTFRYAEKSESLQPTTKVDLAKIARYVKADAAVIGILIDAHSDNASTADINESTSKQQAEWVQAYLVAQGVAAEKIKMRWHADKFPIANNKTTEGRAQNRRVTLRLETETIRRAFTQQAEEYKIAEENAAKQKTNTNAEHAKNKVDSLDQKTTPLTPHTAITDAIKAANFSSDQGEVTPEDVHKMVEGLEFNKKP